MALQADIISFGAHFETVRLMTIAAGYTFVIHPALDKRPIFIDFTVDLPIREIEVVIE